MVSDSGPESVSVTVFPSREVLESTVREAESAPDTDHPLPARSEVDTSSLNVTSMVVAEVALAAVIDGATPSSSGRNSLEEESALPARSRTPLGSYCTKPDHDGFTVQSRDANVNLSAAVTVVPPAQLNWPLSCTSCMAKLLMLTSSLNTETALLGVSVLA